MPRARPSRAAGRLAGSASRTGAPSTADMIVMAVGIRPNAGLARLAELNVNRGIVVDDRCSRASPASTPSANAPSTAAPATASSSRPTSRPACSPIIWPAAMRATPALCSRPISRSPASPCFRQAISLGDADTETDRAQGSRPASLSQARPQDDRLAGAVLVGDAQDALWYLDLIRSGADIAGLRDGLVFGRAFCEHAPERQRTRPVTASMCRAAA